MKQRERLHIVDDDRELRELVTLYLEKKVTAAKDELDPHDALADGADVFFGADAGLTHEDRLTLSRTLSVIAPKLPSVQQATSGDAGAGGLKQCSGEYLKSLTSRELLARIRTILGST